VVSREVVLLGLVLGVLLGVAIIYTYTPATDFSVLNTGPSGLSRIASMYRPLIALGTSYLAGVEPGNYAYLIIRSGGVGAGEVKAVAEFLARGGVVVASGTPEFLNSLMKQLSVGVEVGEAVVYDSIRNYGSRFYPVGYSPTCNSTVVAYLPRYVASYGGAEVVAYSSEFSYADLDGDGYMDLGEPEGRFPLALVAEVGGGRLFVVTSPHVFVNSLLEPNLGFVNCILSGRGLVVDQYEVARDPLQYVRLAVHAGGASEYYVVALVAVAGLVAYGALREW
jgi:hypothetical protein